MIDTAGDRVGQTLKTDPLAWAVPPKQALNITLQIALTAGPVVRLVRRACHAHGFSCDTLMRIKADLNRGGDPPDSAAMDRTPTDRIGLKAGCHGFGQREGHGVAVSGGAYRA